MLPREFIEELFSGFTATGLHVLVALADAFNGFLIVLAVPLQIVGQGIVERVCRALHPPA